MDRLLADPEGRCDLLPRPAPRARVLDLELLDRVKEAAQRRDCAQPHRWVLV